MSPRYVLLRRKDVSAKLKISKTQIYRLVKCGDLPPPHKLSERVSVWSEAEVDAWIAQRLSGVEQ